MMNATKEAEKWDARKHPICPPHDGTRGMKFRRFKNDFLTGLAAWEIKDTNEIYGLGTSASAARDGIALSHRSLSASTSRQIRR